jgi:hypothetical protein
LAPETSYGFEVEEFARTIGRPLDPWQRWLVIHAGESRPDDYGKSLPRLPRFSQILVLVARQNGKTELLRILALYWMWVDRVDLVLGTSANLRSARESWEKAVSFAQSAPEMAVDVAAVRRANGEQEMSTQWGSRYVIAASNRDAVRGWTVSRLILDEFREHQTWEAFSAAKPTTHAVPGAQIWMISNQGDDKSVVLNAKRADALGGPGATELDEDGDLALFEWSSPDSMAATDPEALAMANPNLGHRIALSSLMGDARRAQSAGGEQLASFLTEVHCRRVPLLNPAIDMEAWEACTATRGLDDLRDRVALCLDVSLDELHATLYAAAVDGDRVRVDFVEAWEGQTAVRRMVQELPGLIAAFRVPPRVLGWFPSGPAAAAAAALEEHPGWPPEGVDLAPIRNDVTAVCMGFAEQVRGHVIAHTGDPMLTAHLRAAEKLNHGDGWRFTRRGASHVDAAYAVAGAVHLARTLPVAVVPEAWFA